MEFNGLKFQILHMGQIQYLKDGTILFTSNWNDIVHEQETVKDLSVHIKSHSNFAAQRENSEKKTFKRQVGSLVLL